MASDSGALGVMAVGASAGGVEALRQFASNLPRGLPYAVLVVLPIPPNVPSVLARIVGVLGSAAIRARDGTTIVQSPTDALFAALPLNALEAGVIDHEVPAAEMGGVPSRLAGREFGEREMEPADKLELENRIAMSRCFSTEFDTEALGPPSGHTRPDCNGSLNAVGEGNYRCPAGHARTASALLDARDEKVEGALWIAVRSLREKSNLSRRLAERTGTGVIARRYIEMADEAEHAASVLGDRLRKDKLGVG